MKLESNNTGTFTKQDSVTFDNSLWSSTNGTIDWSKYPSQLPYSESDVFHTQLTHTTSASADIGWTLRIGKGGHIYYIDVEGLGQIICPQRYFSPWNDDCMTTTVVSRDEINKDPEIGGNDSFSNGYIHGSGMYIKVHMDPINNKPFYNPLLSEKFDPTDRSYTTINWGLVPKPSINRGDVLFYSRYRDMGNGILETTFYFYNFGPRVYNFAELPWFAVRPSKLPNMIMGINGTKSFEIKNRDFWDGPLPSNGLWGAHTVNPNDKNSLTCGVVWGRNTAHAVNFGLVDNKIRDMALIAPTTGFINMPYGTGFYCKRYIVFGKLKNVTTICSALSEYATLKDIEFSSDYSGKIPIYKTTLEGQTVLTTTPNTKLVGYIHPIPVKNSLPLILMKNKETGKYFISTDLYAACGKIPFTNPYPVGHIKYQTYQNRHIYQPYDGKTQWISLLGYVLPHSFSNPKDNFIFLSDILNQNNILYIKGEKIDSNQLIAYNMI